MGTVSSYKIAAGKRWKARWRDPEHRSQQKTGFATKREAETYLRAKETSIDTGEYIDARRSHITVGELGAAWLASRTHLKPSTARVEESNWRVHVEPKWGRTPVSGVRHSEVQAWLASIPKSPTIVRNAHALLSAVLETAVLDRRIRSNPARGVKLPRRNAKERVYLTHGQVEALAGAAGSKGTLVRFLSYSGLRWGEATGLLVRDLDSLRRRVTVRQNAVNVGGTIIVGTPKTHKVRWVPFPAFLSIPLARECEGKGRDSILFGDGLDHLRAPTTRDGWFTSACTKVRATDPTFPAHITLHDLRHTAASLSISAGANVKAVQRSLGHASAAMTLDTYADLFEADLDAVAMALDHARASALVSDRGQIGG